MDQTACSRAKLLRNILRGLFFYGLIPGISLWLAARPIRNAVRASETAVFPVIAAGLGAVGLNWGIYALVRRRRPTLPVTAHGLLCVTAVIILVYEALPGYVPIRSVLAYLFTVPVIAAVLLFSFWLAAVPSKPAHAAAVVMRSLLRIFLVGMAWQVARDVEARLITRDTWITVGIIVATIPGLHAQRMITSFRRGATVRRATGTAVGKIVQIIGETYLDRDGDSVTRNHARIQYTVDGIAYETRADISRFTTRRYGRDAFVGRDVSVRYNPADPASAFVNRIDRRVIKNCPSDVSPG